MDVPATSAVTERNLDSSVASRASTTAGLAQSVLLLGTAAAVAWTLTRLLQLEADVAQLQHAFTSLQARTKTRASRRPPPMPPVNEASASDASENAAEDGEEGAETEEDAAVDHIVLEENVATN